MEYSGPTHFSGLEEDLLISDDEESEKNWPRIQPPVGAGLPVAPVMLDQPSTSTSNAASAPKRQLEDMGTSSEESKSPVSKVSKLEKGNNQQCGDNRDLASPLQGPPPYRPIQALRSAVDGMVNRCATVESRCDSIENQLGKIEATIESLVEAQQATISSVNSLSDKLDNILSRISNVGEKVPSSSVTNIAGTQARKKKNVR
ncbi:hypothetical protein Pcinc_032911 [Petrolisthes cinctipes]|uniref:Uncharacterized protein n=1 Tax=Petrolisthes cinctipes TaxID=88211 RepID=A0AAE1K0G4_PETCI|nr:hypothetical protein Pcinc_032911 [Petrolisthes cinctipes]